MLILHTSDLHLSEGKPETIKALDSILRLANERSVDLMTIGGDLFDDVEEAKALRSELRRKFSNNGFDVLSVPYRSREIVGRKNRKTLNNGENKVRM